MVWKARQWLGFSSGQCGTMGRSSDNCLGRHRDRNLPLETQRMIGNNHCIESSVCTAWREPLYRLMLCRSRSTLDFLRLLERPRPRLHRCCRQRSLHLWAVQRAARLCFRWRCSNRSLRVASICTPPVKQTPVEWFCLPTSQCWHLQSIFHVAVKRKRDKVM